MMNDIVSYLDTTLDLPPPPHSKLIDISGQRQASSSSIGGFHMRCPKRLFTNGGNVLAKYSRNSLAVGAGRVLVKAIPIVA
jgi:hypothetical protein